ncbi:DUF2141 domain-containing protein [Sandaracinobacteroides sp. A072]
MIAALALMSTAVFGVPEACSSNAESPAVLVRVHGFKDRVGQLRIAIYRANEEEFLASGRYVQRLDTPLTPKGDMTVCAPVPEAGQHIVVALHDRDANGRFGPFKDGVGFSRNPRLGLSKPDIQKVEVPLDGLMPMSIELNYMRGLRPAPVRQKQNP